MELRNSTKLTRQDSLQDYAGGDAKLEHGMVRGTTLDGTVVGMVFMKRLQWFQIS